MLAIIGGNLLSSMAIRLLMACQNTDGMNPEIEQGGKQIYSHSGLECFVLRPFLCKMTYPGWCNSESLLFCQNTDGSENKIIK